MIKISGTSKFISGIDKWLADTDKELDDAFRGFCVMAFHRLVTETPQWSGSAATNWNLSTGSEDTSTQEKLQVKAWESANQDDWGPVSIKGDPLAVGLAIQRNMGKDAKIKVGDEVYISNSAKSISGQSYIMMLEENPENFLRTDNEPGHMVENVSRRASNLGTFQGPGIDFLASIKLGNVDNGGLY